MKIMIALLCVFGIKNNITIYYILWLIIIIFLKKNNKVILNKYKIERY